MERRIRQSTAAAHLDVRRQRTCLRGGACRDGRADDEGLVENARARGEQLLAGARRLAREISDRSCARLAAWDCWSASSSRTKVTAAGSFPRCSKRGVTAAWTLNLQRVIRFEPPLVVTAPKSTGRLAALRGRRRDRATRSSALYNADAVCRNSHRDRRTRSRRLRTGQRSRALSGVHAGRRNRRR